MVLRRDNSPFTPEFDDLVQQQLEKWKVPGLSIAVVHGSSTYSKAYGFAELPDRKMTTHALFSAFSTTKAFAAAAVSLVIDDSKATQSPIGWDTPIASLIRDDFVLENDDATKSTTLEDALSHRSGLAGHEALITLSDPQTSLRDAVRRLRYLPLSFAPRMTFAYNNHMYMVVSHAVEQITGQSLGSFLKQRIWTPLEMHDTYFSVQDVAKDPELSPRLAIGYTWDKDSQAYNKEPHMNCTFASGGGAMVGNVLDYTKWVRAMIYRRGPISPAGHAALVQPRTVVIDTEEDIVAPPSPYHLYALGWFVHNYRGEQLYWHSGSWPGFGHMVGFLPSKHFGFVMMGNTTNARRAEMEIYLYLLDKLFGGPDGTQLSNSNLSLSLSQRGKETKRAKAASETMSQAKHRLYPSLPDPVIPHGLELYLYSGHYEHPAYGSITLAVNGGHLRANLVDRVCSWLFTLEHASGEFFVAYVYQPKGYGSQSLYFRIEFKLASSGIVQAFGMDLEPASPNEMIWFRRRK